METLARALSRTQGRPYRSKQIRYTDQICLDDKGLLTWSPDDVENPKNWPRGRRWYITIVCIALVMNASIASSAPSGCIPSISEDLGVSQEVAKLTVTLFVAGFCSGPSLWAPLSEYFGRRIVFLTTFPAYFAFSFLCAFATNIGGLLVGRFLCGTLISGVLSNTPGIFVDLWGPIERGNSMILMICALQMGPALGPVTSGFYQLKLNWRWSAYQELWLAAACLFLLPTIPETLPSRALLMKAQRIRKAKIPGFEDVQAPIEVEQRSLLQIFKIALSRPWRILFDPISGLIAIYITVVYALLYMLFTIFPIAFIEIRGWNAGVGELPLLSIIVGASSGGVYVYWDSFRQRRKIAAGHERCAEDTLPVAMVASIVFPIGMFIVSWTGGYAHVHWIAPCIGGVLLSFSICVLFIAFLSYLSESYLMFAASAQAGNQMLRSAVAAASPLYTKQMFSKMTVGGGGSLIAGIAVLLMPIPFVFYRYGGQIRKKSRYAPTPVAATGLEAAVSGDEEAEKMEKGFGSSQTSSAVSEHPHEEVEESDKSVQESIEGDDRFLDAAKAAEGPKL